MKHLNSNKKAMVMKYFVWIILLLFVIFIFIRIENTYHVLFKENTQKQICQKSIFMASVSNLASLDKLELRPPKLNCELQNVDVKSKEEREVVKEITHYMYECYDMVYSGMKDAYKTGQESMITKSMNDQEKYCIPCYNIKFGKKGEEISAEKLLEYQSSATIPKDAMVPEIEKRTYQEYFTDYRTDPQKVKDEIKDKLREKNAAINTDENYLVVFMLLKQGQLEKMDTGLLGMGVGGGVGVLSALALGSTGVGLVVVVPAIAGGWIGYQYYGDNNPAEWDAGLMLVPLKAENLRELGCTYLPADQNSLEEVVVV